MRRSGWLLATLLGLLVACAPRADFADGTSTARAAPLLETPFAPDPSPGCSAGGALPLPAGLTVAGRERSFLLHVPVSEMGPRPLVIAFHGRTGNANRAQTYFGLEEALPDAVIVYPEALPRPNGGSAWHDAGDPADAQRDFALVAALVEALGANLCLDGNRLFVVGHSLGAYFANDLACYLGGRLRGVASVAGGLQLRSCAGASAVLLLHHPEDPLVPLSAGEGARDAFRRANGHDGQAAQPVALPRLAAFGCLRYGPAEHPHPVYWCPLAQMPIAFGRPDPHSWPAGSAEAIASFIRSLP